MADDDRPAPPTDQTPAIFEDFDEQARGRIRMKWYNGRLHMSVIDVVGYLSESTYPNRYWSDLKRKLSEEGATQVYEHLVRLKLSSPDGRLRETDCADTETMLRIVQSVPSPKAEPFKQWLAQVGTERLQDDAVERMRKEYERLGYTDEWISERLRNIVIRNELTDEWRGRGAEEGQEFALLTDTLSKGTFDLTTGEHRKLKHLSKTANLRDSMVPMELVLTSLAELTAAETHQTRASHGFDDLQRDARDAGAVAGHARHEVEELTGKKVVSPTNYKQLRQERQRQLQPPLFGGDDGGETDG
jgi:DNA-damage-inducible protein D